MCNVCTGRLRLEATKSKNIALYIKSTVNISQLMPLKKFRVPKIFFAQICGILLEFELQVSNLKRTVKSNQVYEKNSINRAQNIPKLLTYKLD